MDKEQLLRWIIGLGVYLLAVAAWADAPPQFFPVQTTSTQFDVEEQFTSTNLDDFSLTERRQRYIGEDQPIQEHSILDNNFYRDDSFRVYNNTQYSLDGVKSKYAQAQTSQVTMEDLSISLGYGMEFRLYKNQYVGYEYISSFPHDRGQSIRIFWKRSF